MSRGEILGELRLLVEGLPDRAVAIVLYIVRRLASGERLRPPRDGIGTATEYAAHQCDLAIDRIDELLEHGPEGVISPAGISAPRRA